METILIVEDAIDILKTLNDILVEAKYKTILARNGEEALKKISEEIPDLIISDIIMPKVDGYQLYEKVKNDLSLKNIPFIFLTAKDDYKDFRNGMNLGVDDYIVKPFHVEDILVSINIRLRLGKIRKSAYVGWKKFRFMLLSNNNKFILE